MTRTRASAASVAALLAFAAHGLAGQQPAAGLRAGAGAIAGVVYDSTARAPLAGATVLLVHATRADLGTIAVVADSAGRFVADTLAPGRWMAAFLHRAADEYGVAAVPREVTVQPGDTSTVALALPGARVLRAAVCGREARNDSAGILVGSVVDAEQGAWLGGATVTIAWRVMTMRDGVRLETRRVPVTTSADGTFRVCGLPVADALSVRAMHHARDTTALGSGELLIVVAPAGITRAHLGVGRVLTAADTSRDEAPRRIGTARLSGFVIDPDGRPSTDARIVVSGTGHESVTSASGAFRLDSLPAGSWSVEARSLGYAPVRAAVLLSPGTTTTATLAFEKWVPQLDRVVVYGRASATDRFMDDFLARRERGIGRFVTAQEIAQARINQLSQLLARFPEVRLKMNPRPGRAPLIRGRGDCRAEVYLDGVRIPDREVELDYFVRPEEVLALEVHDDVNGAPSSLGGLTSCLVIGVWTRRR